MFNRRKEKALWQTLTTEENAAEIHRQLYQGMRPGTLASKVQETDPPLFPGRTVAQVNAWFHAYRRKTIYPEWTRDMLGAAQASRRGALIKRLDVVADLEDLAVKMRARFDRFFACESRLVTDAGVPVQLAGFGDIAKDYRATLVEVARLYLETGLLYRVPKKIEAALVTAMDGRPAFAFTDEEVARFERASLIEGMSRASIALGEGIGSVEVIGSVEAIEAARDVLARAASQSADTTRADGAGSATDGGAGARGGAGADSDRDDA